MSCNCITRVFWLCDRPALADMPKLPVSWSEPRRRAWMTAWWYGALA